MLCISNLKNLKKKVHFWPKLGKKWPKMHFRVKITSFLKKLIKNSMYLKFEKSKKKNSLLAQNQAKNGQKCILEQK